jgi:hypothetical protein
MPEPVAFNAWLMEEPEPAVPPEAPDWVMVQANVEPDTVLVSAVEAVAPEQIVCVEGVAVATGVGFTVTVTLIGDPGQPAALGVMV